MNCNNCQKEVTLDNTGYAQKGENTYKILITPKEEIEYEQDEFEADDSGLFYCRSCGHKIMDFEEGEKYVLDLWKKEHVGIKKWLDYTFVSSSSETPEFLEFYKDFKKEIQTQCKKNNFELVRFEKGHFDIFGLIKHQTKFVYFSFSDVRHFPNEWSGNILIRTAKDEKDYTGGSNNYTTLEKFVENVKRLFKEE